MKKIHYAWVICFACALMLFCTSGLCINAFTIYMPYIRIQNGFTNAQSSAIITVRSLFSFASVFLTGFYFKHISLRWGTFLGGFLAVLSFAVFGLARSYFAYCAAAALCGLGYGFCGMVPVAILLEHWFAQKRTLAVGLCAASTGLAVLGVPQLLTWMIETFGLQLAFFTEGVVILALLTVVWMLLRDRPADKGLLPYGAEETQAAFKVVRYGRKLEKRAWLLLVPMLLMLGTANSVGYSHLTMLATAEGFGSQTVATAITATGLFLIVGKCAYGWISEKLGTVACNWIMGSLLIAGLALCCITSGSEVLLFTAMCAYGAGLSMASVGMTAWAGELASPEQHDSTVRWFQTLSSGGALVFSSVPGILADLFGGSYVPAYIGFTAFAALAVLIIQYLYHKGRKA